MWAQINECKFMYVQLTCSSSSTTTNVSLFFLKSRRVILGLIGNIYDKHVEMKSNNPATCQNNRSASVNLTKKRGQFC